MRKLLIALLVLVSIFAFVSCDDSKNVPDEITVSTWDGTIDKSWYTKGTTEYTLTEASQLAGLAELVNGKTDDFKGVTIKLANNINLNNKQWTPIGLYSDEEDTTDFEKKPFSGTFDGQNHTIIGLKIELDNKKSSYRALFGYVNGTVENLTVAGTVIACDSAGVVGALGDGGKIDHVTNKVNVSNTTSTGGDYPHAKAAGIVVAVKKGTATISNCTNDGTITSTATDTRDDAVGGIVAWSNASNLTITGCVNNGKIESKGGQYAGGIIGAVRKHKDDATAEVPVKISNCKNNAVITAESKIVGGIIGQVGTYATNPLKPTLTDCSTANDYKLVGTGDVDDSSAK